LPLYRQFRNVRFLYFTLSSLFFDFEAYF